MKGMKGKMSCLDVDTQLKKNQQWKWSKVNCASKKISLNR